VAVDSAGNLYIADSFNNVIRKVNALGTITTVAGNGTGGYSGDGGPATSAELNNPDGVAVDSAGNLYIADSGNSVIRKVNASGIITTVAGGGTPCGTETDSLGDGCPATSAELNIPGAGGVAVDSAGNLYIADTYNYVIRKVNASGIITTVAGTPGLGGAVLDAPIGVAVDSAANLYIADPIPERIRKVSVTTSALSFPSTNVGQTSSAESLVVSDVGNAPLNFSALAASANFQVVSVTGADSDCAVGTALAVGTDCLLGAQFAPLAAGNSLTGSITVTDDAFNSPQAVSLSGVAPQAATTVAVTQVNPSSEIYGQNAAATITAVLSWTGDGPAPAAGNVTVSTNAIGGTLSGVSCGAPSSDTITCAATYTPDGTTLEGTYTMSAAFSGDSNYSNSSSTQTNNFSITQATSGVSVISSLNPSVAGQQVTFTASITAPVLPPLPAPSTVGSLHALDAGGINGEYGLVRRRKGISGPSGQTAPPGVSGSVTWSANTGCGTTSVTDNVPGPSTASCVTTILPPGHRHHNRDLLGRRQPRWKRGHVERRPGSQRRHGECHRRHQSGRAGVLGGRHTLHERPDVHLDNRDAVHHRNYLAAEAGCRDRVHVRELVG
jgi:sugar lactone lactonase YvrE